jgi:hypothetical protein
VFKLVHDWMRIEVQQNWLLVIDNADDAAFLGLSKDQDGAESDRLRYLRETANGTILITSRSKKVARLLVEESQIIEVGTINAIEAESLLRTKLGPDIDDSGVPELAAALGYMPLALIHAAAYIRRRHPRCTIRHYLDQFQKNDHNKLGLLKLDDIQLRKHAKDSVITTWEISFDHISTIRPSAADLLSLMSFFDRQGIPESLLRNRTGPRPTPPRSKRSKLAARFRSKIGGDTEIGSNKDAPAENEEEITDDQTLSGDIQTLRDYSFISVTTDASTFEMHALVQLSMRTWLLSRQSFEAWKEVFIHNLWVGYPETDDLFQEMDLRRRLFPHANAALDHKPRAKVSLLEWARLMHRAGWHASESGSYAAAKNLFQAALEVYTLIKIITQETW